MSCGHWRRLAIFDLDGCLVDTRSLVEKAYRRVGVTMPAFAWGRPWRAWLPDLLDHDEVRIADVRRRKREMYLNLLRHPSRQGRLELPPAEVARELQHQDHQVAVLTGASPTVAHYLVSTLGLKAGSLTGSMLDLEGKVERLRSLAREREAVYVDDDLTTVTTIRELVGIESVRYTNQDTETLRKELEDAWTR